jgi:sugar phosphate isomerase/epimerase
MFKPRLAVSAMSYERAIRRGKLALEGVPAAVRDLGLGAIEVDDMLLRARSPLKQRASDLLMRRYFGRGVFFREYTSDRLLDLHMAFQESGVRGVAWAAHTDFTLTGRAARWQMHYLEGAVAAADDFGGRLVCVRAGGPERPTDEQLARGIEGLKQAAQLAHSFHTRLALETGQGMARDAGCALKLVRGAGHPSLGLCLNFDGTDAGALAPYAIHARAIARAFDAQGFETTVDYPACMAALQAANYEGWIALDYAGKSYPALGIMQTAELIGALAS